MHPAHTLPANSITFAAGTTGHLTALDLSSAQDDLERAATPRSGATTNAARERFAQGALAKFAVAPGVAPFVAARAGLGQQNEAGLSYTGRSLRLDGRHAFEWPSVALSVGLVAIGALPRVQDEPDRDIESLPRDGGLRATKLLSTRGYGLELPVVFGYRSSADVVKLWAGLRTGFERDAFRLSLVQTPQDAFAASGEATRLWAGGLVGFSVGLAPVEVRAELDASYETVSGQLQTADGDLRADVAGVSLTPAMAISAKF